MIASSPVLLTAILLPLLSAGGAQAETYTVQETLDIRYHDGSDRQVLDVLRPKGVEGRPVVLFVHGGAWMIGDKCLFGLYRGFGRFLAKQGIVAVMINYRLSPAVKHPEHIRDVARAFAWTRRHIKEYGGDPDRIFLCGHSAGGHLVSLLATNECYLKDENLKLTDADCKAIRGVISICGVYLIPTGEEFAALVADMLTGLLSKGERPWALRLVMGRLVRDVKDYNPFPLVFGDDPKSCEQASPVKHVRKGLPPFLLVNAEMDLPTLPAMAKEFAKALEKDGNTVEAMTLKHRDHNLIVFQAQSPDDPLGKAILEFIEKHGKPNAASTRDGRKP
jgi:acetyl esterase/lipase